MNAARRDITPPGCCRWTACFSCGLVNGPLLFLLQGLRLRQQEQPPDEGAGGAAPVQGSRAEPRRLRPAGSGHGQRHLPQVCLGFFSLFNLILQGLADFGEK